MVCWRRSGRWRCLPFGKFQCVDRSDGGATKDVWPNSMIVEAAHGTNLEIAFGSAAAEDDRRSGVVRIEFDAGPNPGLDHRGLISRHDVKSFDHAECPLLRSTST